MNESVQYHVPTATAAVVSLATALGVSDVSNTPWPSHESPLYVTRYNEPTFSFVGQSLIIMDLTTAEDFRLKISAVYASLSEGQTPLGAEFEAVWDNNIDQLYES